MATPLASLTDAANNVTQYESYTESNLTSISDAKPYPLMTWLVHSTARLAPR